MGRPPCCDKIGVKKGPWTPEEDLMLVSHIQEHGPGNWRAVPSNSGLLRCSKSCRLRWTNYLRPGIKRGNFTDQEEKLIIHLQALLGNRWAAMASYLPERTDNDIKNYWNTHLKKKLRRASAAAGGGGDGPVSDSAVVLSRQLMPKGQWERRLQTDIHTAKQALCEALSLDDPSTGQPAQPSAAAAKVTTYASSTENIARLLQGWVGSSPKPGSARGSTSGSSTQRSSKPASSEGTSATNRGSGSPEGAELLPDFDSLPVPEMSSGASQVPLSMLETWLFGDSSGDHGDVGLDIDMPLDDPAGFF